MNIAFLHTDFRVYWLPRLRELEKRLSADGHELHVLEISGKGSPYAFSEARGGCGYWQCLFPEKSMEELSPRAIRRAVCGALDSLRPDIVFAGAIAYASGANATYWCRKNHVPLVIFDNARLVDVPRSMVTNFIKRQIYKNVDAVLIPAPSHAKDYRYWGFEERMMYDGLNVVSNRYWRELAGQNGRLAAALPPQYLLGIGRQVAKKNWLSLLEAYRRSGLTIPLVLVGNGPEHEALLQRVEAYGLEEQVLFEDFQPPEELAPLYAHAKAVVLPSSYGETWGLTVNEAMACGTPVIVSRQCGCCETLCMDGKTGFCCDPDVDGIEQALMKMMRLTAEEEAAMRLQVRNVIDQWDVDRFSDSVVAVSEKMCGRPAGGFSSLLSRWIVSMWKGRFRPV